MPVLIGSETKSVALGLTVTATNIDESPGSDLFIAGANVAGAGNPSLVVGVNFFVETLDLSFVGTTTAGFDVGTIFSDSNVVVSVFGPGNALLGTFNIATTGAGVSFGVVSDAGLISRINLASTGFQAEWVDSRRAAALRSSLSMTFSRAPTRRLEKAYRAASARTS